LYTSRHLGIRNPHLLGDMMISSEKHEKQAHPYPSRIGRTLRWKRSGRTNGRGIPRNSEHAAFGGRERYGETETGERKEEGLNREPSTVSG